VTFFIHFDGGLAELGHHQNVLKVTIISRKNEKKFAISERKNCESFSSSLQKKNYGEIP